MDWTGTCPLRVPRCRLCASVSDPRTATGPRVRRSVRQAPVAIEEIAVVRRPPRVLPARTSLFTDAQELGKPAGHPARLRRADSIEPLPHGHGDGLGDGFPGSGG